jgi:hypothetical protein
LEVVSSVVRAEGISGEAKQINASQFGFPACHSTTQHMRLMDHVTLKFNKYMSMAAVFLDIKRAFDTT